MAGVSCPRAQGELYPFYTHSKGERGSRLGRYYLGKGRARECAARKQLWWPAVDCRGGARHSWAGAGVKLRERQGRSVVCKPWAQGGFGEGEVKWLARWRRRRRTALP